MKTDSSREKVTSFAVAAGVTLIVFSWLQFSTTGLLDVDGYYHIKWSRLIWERFGRGGYLMPEFSWLPFTVLNPKDYVDHHLFFHFLLIPFTFGDMRLGAKIAAILFGSLAVLSCYWLLVRYSVRYPLVWLIAILASAAEFLFRMTMTRAQSVSVVFTCIGIYLLFERRYRWLALLAFLYVWTYSLFVILLGASVIWVGVLWWSEKKLNIAPILYTFAGTVAGFIINPYFPKNLKLFWEHLLTKANPLAMPVNVGGEWYPYNSWELLGGCAIAFICMLSGYTLFTWRDRKVSEKSLFFLLFSTLLMIATFRSRRFVEYWPPFAVLFAAFTLQVLFDRARSVVGAMPSEVVDDLEPYLDRSERADVEAKNRLARRRRSEVAYAVGAALFIVMLGNVSRMSNVISRQPAFNTFRGCVEWIRGNVPRDEIIFHTDWDEFPMLFYFDSDHRYVAGLDPTYLLRQNPDLYKRYVDVTLGREANAAPIIRDQFRAKYVFSDNEPVHLDFYTHATESGMFEQVYIDDKCTVMEILDSPKPKDERREEENQDALD
jgi:hypothetical protein